jgi:hypothetical protein
MLQEMPQSGRPTVYIETSIISYLTARPSSDLLAAAWQRATADWWETQRGRFDLYTSDVVLAESSRGHPQAAARRLETLQGIPTLPITDAVKTFSLVLLRDGILPARALDDSLHIAVSAVHELDYLLTWNCRHIDNAEVKPLIRSVCIVHGYVCPEICTPQELMGGTHYDR